MKKALLFLGSFAAFTSFAQDCQSLIISEYVEGFSNNKALEIYNPTANSIDLTQYFIARYSNGATTISAGDCVQLVGSIAPYSTHVGVLDKRDPQGTGQEAPIWDELQAKADAFYSPVYDVSKAWYWNGNDAIMLAKGSAANPNATSTVLVDVFGKIGQDPVNNTAGTNGWSSIAPYNFTSGNPMDKVVTEDHSMIRKATVLVGKNNVAEIFGGSYVFNPLLQYDSIPASLPKIDATTGDTVYQGDGVTPQWVGNWESLGVHACNCAPDASVSKKTNVDVSIYPNPSNGSFFVKGIANVQTIEIYNSLGQKVKSINDNTKSIVSVDLGSNSGMYILKLVTYSGESFTNRLIIK